MIYGEIPAPSKIYKTPKPPVCVAAVEAWHRLLIPPTARRRARRRRPPRHSHNHSRTRPPMGHPEVCTPAVRDPCQVNARDPRSLRKVDRTLTVRVPVVVQPRIASGRGCRVEDRRVPMLTLVFGSRSDCPDGKACIVASAWRWESFCLCTYISMEV